MLILSIGPDKTTIYYYGGIISKIERMKKKLTCFF